MSHSRDEIRIAAAALLSMRPAMRGSAAKAVALARTGKRAELEPPIGPVTDEPVSASYFAPGE